MTAKFMMKNPVLIIGILLMVIFLSTSGRKLLSRKEALNPTSCKAVLVKLNRRIPKNWSTKCKGNNLTVIVKYKDLDKKVEADKQKLRKLLYRELANFLTHIAKNSPSDNLELTDIVRLKLDQKNLVINAVTEGKFIVKLSTLSETKNIKEHLRKTVKVQEVVKN